MCPRCLFYYLYFHNHIVLSHDHFVVDLGCEDINLGLVPGDDVAHDELLGGEPGEGLHGFRQMAVGCLGDDEVAGQGVCRCWEIIVLIEAHVAGEYHAVVSAHIRGESSNLIRATEEFLSIVRSAKVRGVLSHHKASGKENWGKVTHTLRMLQEANDEGYEVYCDVYPYIASHTSLAATFVPSELHALGVTKVLADPAQRAKIREWILGKWGSNDDFGWIQIAMCKGYPDYEGLRIPEIAKRHGKDVYETIFDMIHDSDNACSACYFTMCEEDVKTVMAWERTMIGTDSSVARGNKVYHPRLRGTFPRVLGKYVREEGVTTLTEMIRKITSMPATVYGLRSKGQLHEGFDADICIFDAEVIIDRAEFTACWQRAEGLKYVLLGGEVVVEDAVYNGKRLGHVMKREAL